VRNNVQFGFCPTGADPGVHWFEPFAFAAPAGSAFSYAFGASSTALSYGPIVMTLYASDMTTAYLTVTINATITNVNAIVSIPTPGVQYVSVSRPNHASTPPQD
jgi:hypothetical protein